MNGESEYGRRSVPASCVIGSIRSLWFGRGCGQNLGGRWTVGAGGRPSRLHVESAWPNGHIGASLSY
jgi:hypothetical protein